MRKGVIFNYINSNKKQFFLILIVFIIGIIGGVFFINHTSNSEFDVISLYIETLKNNIKNKENINKFSCLLEILKQNCTIIITIWLFGTTILGSFIIYVIVLYKGFSLGYTISALIASLGIKGGSIFVFSFLLPQNMILLPSIFILSERGLNVYSKIMKNNVNIKTELIRYFIIMLIVLLLSALASVIEIYLSTNLLMFFKKFI